MPVVASRSLCHARVSLLVRCSAGLVTTGKTFTRGSLSREHDFWATLRARNDGKRSDPTVHIDLCQAVVPHSFANGAGTAAVTSRT